MGPGSGTVGALADAVGVWRSRRARTSTGGAALARQWVDLSPLRMWVLPASLPACRGPTITCMGFVDDLPAPSLRLRESGPAAPVPYLFAGSCGPHWFVSRWWTRPGGGFWSLTPG